MRTARFGVCLAGVLAACGGASPARPTTAPGVASSSRAAVSPVSDPPSATSVALSAPAVAEHGDPALATAMLRERLAAHPEDVEARIALGSVLMDDGDVEGALAVWREGLVEDAAHAGIYLAIGETLAQQAEDGPGIRRTRTMIQATSTPPDLDVDAWSRERRVQARDAFSVALRLAPASRDAALDLAAMQRALGDPEAAVATLRPLWSRDAEDGEVGIDLARALAAAAHDDEALAVIDALHSHFRTAASPYELEAEIRARRHDARGARAARERGALYRWLVPGSGLAYDARLAAAAQALSTGRGFNDALRAAIATRSAATSFLLASFVRTHTHDADEEAAWAELRARGTEALPAVRAVLDVAGSTCTIRSALRILAEEHAPDAFERTVIVLPRDIGPTFLSVDAAGALARLGDRRAVPELAAVLDRPIRADPDDPMAQLGLEEARARAALALGHFAGSDVETILRRHLSDPTLAAGCHAALYRLTQDASHLAALEMDEVADSIAAFDIADDLADQSHPRVRALLARWRERLDRDAAE